MFLIFRCMSNTSEKNIHKFFICLNRNRAMFSEDDEVFLEKHLVSKEPIGQFKSWFEDACSRKEILGASAMCLATTSKDGFPSARFMILKAYGKDGFKFLTDYESRKAREMAENPNVAATFYWEVLSRSVRIEGHVEKLSEDEAEKYFHSRPIQSQIATVVSNQSIPIESTNVLLERMSKLEAGCKESVKEVPKPSNWGGFRIVPMAVEFWKGRKNRLSDRIRFRKLKSGEIPDGKILHEGEGGWVYERLSP